MSHKKKPSGPAPIPPGNQPQAGPAASKQPDQTVQQDEGRPTSQAAAQEQDPDRRLGRYQGTGEHAFVQPTPKRGNRD
jgi:hypothetical protein